MSTCYPDGRSNRVGDLARVCILSAALVPLVCLAARATAVCRSDAVPSIVFTRTECDIGEIKAAKESTAEFEFANAGGAVLRITEVRLCCGATFHLDKESLEPGETGTLAIRYRASWETASLSKNIVVCTNDPEKPTVILTITGRILRTLVWEPVHLQLRPNEANAGCPDLVLRSLDGTPFSVTACTATDNCIHLDVDPNCRTTEFILKPRIDLKKLQSSGLKRGRLRIELGHPDYRGIDLDFTVQQRFEAHPGAIPLFETDPARGMLAKVRILDTGIRPGEPCQCAVASVTVDRGRLLVHSIDRIAKGHELTLCIVPPPPIPGSQRFRDRMVIRLTNGVELPVKIFGSYTSTLAAETVTR